MKFRVSPNNSSIKTVLVKIIGNITKIDVDRMKTLMKMSAWIE